MGLFNQDDQTYGGNPEGARRDAEHWRQLRKEGIEMSINFYPTREERAVLYGRDCEKVVKAGNGVTHPELEKALMKLKESLENKMKLQESGHIEDVANLIISHIKGPQVIDVGTHPDYLSGRISALLECLKAIDVRYGTTYILRVQEKNK